MIPLSKKFRVYACVVIPLQYSFRNRDDTFVGWGGEEKITTEFKKKERSLNVFPVTVSSSSIFSCLSIITELCTDLESCWLIAQITNNTMSSSMSST